MPFQIKPKEYLPIVRQLSDPADANTYYVRAYVYKHIKETETLLATLDLSDQTGQRFTYHYEVPADAEGEGYYLSIVTKVFTDSGYTSESALYGRTEQSYLVAERWSMAFRGVSGADVDYKKVRKIIEEELSKLSFKQEKVNLDPILSRLEEVKTIINSVEIPIPKETNLAPVFKELKRIEEEFIKEIANIPFSELDLSPVIRSIENLKGKQALSVQSLNDYIKKVKQVLGDAIEKIRIKTEGMEEKIEASPVVTLVSGKEKPRRKRFI